MTTYVDAVALVENGERHFGRFQHTPIANPLDAVGWPGRAYAWFRTKEWVGFTLIHPEIFSSMIIQDAKYLTTGDMYVADQATGVLVELSANCVAKPLRLPRDLLHAPVSFAASGYRLGYRFAVDSVEIAIDIDKGLGIRGQLSLNAHRASAPLVVSSRLPGGLMYTNKIVYPAEGTITCGDRTYVFEPDRDFAILDEHHSALPYRSEWTWGTFALPTAAGIVGANFAARPSVPGEQEESCVWTPEAAEPLADVTFERVGDGDLAPYAVRSADGRLDVTFTPEGGKHEDLALGVVEMHYVQQYGSYAGTVASLDGRIWPVDGVHGVLEHMLARL
jgi:hypothetical protein